MKEINAAFTNKQDKLRQRQQRGQTKRVHANQRKLVTWTVLHSFTDTGGSRSTLIKCSLS